MSDTATWTTNRELAAWVNEMEKLLEPSSIHIVDGSDEEAGSLAEELVKSGSFIRLNETLRPNSFLVRSSKEDVARVEESTFICSKEKKDAGPTNNWEEPNRMKERLLSYFKGSMKGRTLYVIPFSMGPIHSPLSKIGVQLTDSAYVVLNMRIMTRVGTAVLKALGDGPFVHCLHSVGYPLEEGKKDIPWPSDPKLRTIAHFPEELSVWSFGSGYGGNALLGKKCFALRLASKMARDEGWLAEHMLILGITNPEGKKRYIAAAFPSACGKTNLAMLQPTLPGWKVETVGDDIAWMRFGEDGQLYAINPEFGFFGVAPGTSMRSNPNALLSCKANSIFTNVALTDEGDVWWEEMTITPPKHLLNWLGHDWTPESKERAAHLNSRFTAPAKQCPVIDPNWESPEGVPISAILFGGRRSTTVPLVTESLSWEHGVFMGASISSEMTAAAAGTLGKLRHDPFAMLPFCGYNMGDYFSHWLSFGKKSGLKLPKIYYVNWFRKGKEGKFLWPGYGENVRVLKWIFDRAEGAAAAKSSPIGNLPDPLDLTGLSLSGEALEELFHVDKEEWKREARELRQYFTLFGDTLPKEITEELQSLEARL